ncbi:Protein kinase A anchor protein [Babesia duncani]|uniref:Protein kinase A anchor protein n=1 Tax=Babesia duncani TaxID=323732 RepID=A0AAD9UPJ2_9APIC|nr:Protein kinase A anchor protein [Babesia duncani]
MKHIDNVQKLYGVYVNLQNVDDEWKMTSTGPKAKESLDELVNICRKSNLYNYYLCLPIRGMAFNEKLLSYHEVIKQKYGKRVNFVRRPHVTLALLNLVTDEDVALVVKALQEVTVTLGFLRSSPQDFNIAAHLRGLDAVVQKGKNKANSVLMANVKFDETMYDIVKSYQNAVNKIVNKMMDLPPKMRVKRGKLGVATEQEAASQGINVTRSGQIEINYADISRVDPSTLVPKSQVKDLKPNVNIKASPVLSYEDEKEKQAQTSEELDYVYDTSVPHDFHMTILRHEQAKEMVGHEFDITVPLNCVELRPRYDETCLYRTFTKNGLLTFTGDRYDQLNDNPEGIMRLHSKPVGRQEGHSLTDVLASKAENESDRFVFYF